MASNSSGTDQLPVMPPGRQSNAIAMMPNPRPRHKVYDTQPLGTNALILAANKAVSSETNRGSEDLP